MTVPCASCTIQRLLNLETSKGTSCPRKRKTQNPRHKLCFMLYPTPPKFGNIKGHKLSAETENSREMAIIKSAEHLRQIWGEDLYPSPKVG